MRLLLKLLSIALLMVCSNVAVAEQRALLVGVGKYSNPRHDLPAIELDLETMQSTLNRMGFEDSQIRSLRDEEATSKNVVREFKTWLRDGVEADDMVVFYFSGHGSFNPDKNGDEADGVDEVLVTHDVKVTGTKKNRALIGVVPDDTLSELIAAIPSNNVWTIIDACHSGTATRGFDMDNESFGDVELYEKSYTYDGMPIGNDGALDRSIEADDQFNFVSISAAGDGQKAIGTSRGGVFTNGLSAAIEDAALSGDPLTIIELRDLVELYILEHVDKSRAHTPQVTGNPVLASTPLPLTRPADGNGPNRKKLRAIVAETDSTFEFAANATTIRLGQLLELEMSIPIEGYLNVVTVDSQDQATVLFPNAYHADNAVKVGPINIPAKTMAFELNTLEPTGETMIIAFVTKDRINFFEQNLDQRNPDGTINVNFTKLSTTATRGFAAQPKGKGKYATVVDVTVTQ